MTHNLMTQGQVLLLLSSSVQALRPCLQFLDFPFVIFLPSMWFCHFGRILWCCGKPDIGCSRTAKASTCIGGIFGVRYSFCTAGPGVLLSSRAQSPIVLFFVLVHMAPVCCGVPQAPDPGVPCREDAQRLRYIRLCSAHKANMTAGGG
jgi:hypothetical protein